MATIFLKKKKCLYWNTQKWNFFEHSFVHENVQVYELVCEIFFEISLNFFKNCPRLIQGVSKKKKNR